MELVITTDTWKLEFEDGEIWAQGTFEPEVDLNGENWNFFDQITERVGEMSDLEIENLGEGAYVSDDAKTMAWKVWVICGHYGIEIDRDGETWVITDKYGNTLETGEFDPEIDIPAEKIGIINPEKINFIDLDEVTERIAQLSGMKLVNDSIYAGSYSTSFGHWFVWDVLEVL
ncbi:Uncharacterised protein [Actinobaculum suis]|uniref:Uncharacterized protein n=1 Tax=Actinobaculum suis TaxID=1657 RepID=A0A7Z8Y7I4_9ACTO|nr:hypothetical protein [Actinobaculum suis]VDG75284.1 Uncharacterised protein [Actinobaculum suis]